MSMNRRTLITRAAACAVAPALPTTAIASIAAPSDVLEVIAIYKDLNAGRQARMLGHLRDCLAAQRIIETKAAS